jgi:hypothetical protein
MVQTFANEPAAEAMRRLHPNRLRFDVFSDRNPLMAPVAGLAAAVREQRRPVAPDNPFLVLESAMSEGIVRAWETWGEARDMAEEAFFLTAYGSPLLRAAVGLGQAAPGAGRRVERDLVREADEARARAALEQRFEVGAPLDAGLRALCYVHDSEGYVDEREWTVLRRLRDSQPPGERRSFGELKEAMKAQSLLIRLDGERAIAAIPRLLADQPERSRATLKAVHELLDARDGLSDEGRRRLERIDALFDTQVQTSTSEASHA